MPPSTERAENLLGDRQEYCWYRAVPAGKNKEVPEREKEQEKLTKEINDLNLKLPILEKEIKEIKAKIK